MIPATDSASAVSLPPPPQQHRLSTSCDRHPDERFTGFCPSCLCERLAVLDQSNNGGSGTSSSCASRKPPTISAAAIKAIFKPSGNTNNASNVNGRVRPGFFPELRRTKSFSASKNEGFSGVFEPQRRSCDVRLRSSLWNLFNQDEHRNPLVKDTTAAAAAYAGEIEVEPRKSSVREPVLETKEEGEADSDGETDQGVEEEEVNDDDNGDFEIVNESSEVTWEGSNEIVEEEEEQEVKVSQEDLKPMKDYIDLDSHVKKPSVRDFAGSFWSAASVFSKKLQKWRQKQKMKKQRNGGGSARLPVEKPIGRQLRDTQSEIADYGFGRRSCDTDPRFSLDAGRFSLDAGRFSVDIGRVSLDDPRYSFDEPRASWDGYLTGRATSRVPPPPSMLSVVEDAPVHRHVMRSDMQIPVEEQPPVPPAVNNESDPVVPGGSAQTREYYTDCSSRRRKSFERSSSIRKTAVGIAAETEEHKPVSNSKVSPAITMDSYSNSKDDCTAEMTEARFVPPPMNGERKTNHNKKSKRWSKWSILGLIYRKNIVKYEEEEEEDDRYSRSNGTVERSLSESWSELRTGGGGFNIPKMTRSNSNVSWRSNGSGGGLGFGGTGRKSNGGWLERNRSWRNSSKEGENGMLRFYLAPMKGSRRSTAGGGGWEKTAARANSHGHSIARTVMRLY